MGKKLTARVVDLIKPDQHQRREISDAVLPGLYFIVQPSGAKSWAVRYRHSGVSRKFTLGPYPKITLGEARQKARIALQAVDEGRDPALERKEAKRRNANLREDNRDLFKLVADEFLRRHVRPNNRPSWSAEVERLLKKELLPLWSTRQVQSIQRRDIIEMLDGIVDRGGGITANRVLAVVRRLFNWTIERGIVETSPCINLKPPLTERSRDRILTDNELCLFWHACDVIRFPFGAVGKLLLLTAQRRDEVGAMTSRELDLNERIWTIPRERSKNDEAHSIPLSKGASDIIETLPTIRTAKQYLFTTTGETPVSGWSRAKKKIDQLMLEVARDIAYQRGENPDQVEIARWTFHDLRRTAASGMARLGIALPVVEKVLNHRSGSFGGIVGVYQRHDFAGEKREALKSWSRFVLSLTDSNRYPGSC